MKKKLLVFLIPVLVIASLAAACHISPRWKLVGESESGFKAVVVEKTWLPGGREAFGDRG